MRWNQNKPKFKSGDTRLTTKFLWIPTCLEGEWRWLEDAVVVEEFLGYGLNQWKATRWV
jgi:hypothetical protein